MIQNTTIMDSIPLYNFQINEKLKYNIKQNINY